MDYHLDRLPLLQLVFILLGCFLTSLFASKPVKYSVTPNVPFDWDDLQRDTSYFQDTSTGMLVYQIQDTAGIPLYYAQDISTEVCFDNKCRQLLTTIYWNITGRYLGFGLPEGEYLSRQDHEAFVERDYLQLNNLLADPYLPFGEVSFQELIQPDETLENVDGISGATSQSISAYVVSGAAYTTYTMWNIVYGPMQSWIRDLTEKELSPGLLALILRGGSSEDKIWALGKIDVEKELESEVEEVLLELIGDDDFFVAHNAINTILPGHLDSESLQIGLFSKYDEINFNLRGLILEKLMQASCISPIIISRSSDILASISGVQLDYFLAIYKEHDIDDPKVLRSVASLLNQDNSFITEKAYRFLVDLEIEDGDIHHALKAYKQGR